MRNSAMLAIFTKRTRGGTRGRWGRGGCWPRQKTIQAGLPLPQAGPLSDAHEGQCAPSRGASAGEGWGDLVRRAGLGSPGKKDSCREKGRKERKGDPVHSSSPLTCVTALLEGFLPTPRS